MFYACVAVVFVVGFLTMGEFLDVMLAIIFFVTPKDIDRVQIWPYAADTNSHTRELSLTFQRTKNGWCPDFSETNRAACVEIANGRWLDESGKVLLDIKGNLKVTHRTNYLLCRLDYTVPIFSRICFIHVHACWADCSNASAPLIRSTLSLFPCSPRCRFTGLFLAVDGFASEPQSRVRPCFRCT